MCARAQAPISATRPLDIGTRNHCPDAVDLSSWGENTVNLLGSVSGCSTDACRLSGGVIRNGSISSAFPEGSGVPLDSVDEPLRSIEGIVERPGTRRELWLGSRPASQPDVEFDPRGPRQLCGPARSGLEALFGEPVGEWDGECSQLGALTGAERVCGGDESVGCDGVSVGPVFPGGDGVVSGFGVFGGWVVVVDLSPPGSEVPDVADEIAAFAVELAR